MTDTTDVQQIDTNIKALVAALKTKLTALSDEDASVKTLIDAIDVEVEALQAKVTAVENALANPSNYVDLLNGSESSS